MDPFLGTLVDGNDDVVGMVDGWLGATEQDSLKSWHGQLHFLEWPSSVPEEMGDYELLLGDGRSVEVVLTRMYVSGDHSGPSFDFSIPAGL